MSEDSPSRRGESGSSSETASGGPVSAQGGLIAIAIARPVTVVVGVLLVLLFGTLSLWSLPIQLTPDISRPTLSVSTIWPGAGPMEIEADVLEPQEEVLKGISGLTEMRSQASFGSGSVTLEFEVGTDIDEALVRASNALSQISSYPDAADEPSLQTSDTSGPPLAVIAVRSKAGRAVAAYRSWIEDNIVPRIERIDGVSSARLIGGRNQEVHIDFDANELAARGVSIGRLVQRVREELRDISGGDLTLGKRRVLIRTEAAPDDPTDLEELVLQSAADGSPVLLSDVAQVRIGLRKPTGVAMSDDRPSMVFLLSREAGSNVLEVTEALRQEVKALNQERFAPEGLEIEVLSDQTGYIYGALSLVRQNLLLGACFAVVVLLLFLRSVGASGVIAIAIPVSVFGTALGMALLGRSVNVVSLAGITFAIGMVLDNSIVALEAIDADRAEGKAPPEAALSGVRRVWGALLASTATTMAVFVPVLLWQGEVGQLLRDVAVAIATSVGISFFVSVWVIPSLAARLLGRKKRTPGKLAGLLEPVDRVARAALERITQGARAISRSRLVSFAVVATAVSVCAGTAVSLLPALEYLPQGNRNLIFGVLIPPAGTAVEELERVGVRVQARMTSDESLGPDGKGPEIARSFFVGSPGGVFAGAVAQDPSRVRDLLTYLRQVQSEVPGMLAFTTQASLFGRSVGGGRSIELRIFGGDLEELSEVTGALFSKIKAEFPKSQARPVPSLSSGAPELVVTPKRRQAAPFGLSPADLGTAVDALVDGTYVGELSRDGRSRLDVVVRGFGRGGRSYADPVALSLAPISVGAQPGAAPAPGSTALESAAVIPLAVAANLQESSGPTVLQRIERRRAMTIQLSPAEETPLEEAIEMLKREVIEPARAEGLVPPSVELSLSGSASDLDAAKDRFVQILLLALLISFLLMAALFEDFLAPVVVLVTVPLAAAGGVLGLFLLDSFGTPQPFDLMTALGFLILLGVVVNNAILVVDGALQELRRGTGLEEAVAAGVQARVRPILMTTATSLAGLLPMVVIPGSGSELYRGVGAIVLGGLALSTVLTLFVVPALFSLLWRIRRGALMRS